MALEPCTGLQGGRPGVVRGAGDTSCQWQQEVPGLEQVGCSLAGGPPRGPGASCALLPSFLLSPPLRVSPFILAFPQMDPTEPRAKGQERAQGRAHVKSQGVFLRARKLPAPPHGCRATCRRGSFHRQLLGADRDPVLSAGTGYGPGLQAPQAVLCHQPPM